jgi:hypothetical protein
MPRKPSPDSDSCADCVHWREQTESQDEIRWGMCHRYPPTPVGTTDDEGADTVSSVIPWTELPFVCGELKRRLQ